MFTRRKPYFIYDLSAPILLDSSEYKTLLTRNGKFTFRVFLGKMNYKTQCLFRNLNNFLGSEKSYLPNGRVINDLHSPDTFDTRVGERAGAYVQPWF